jgi:outer membrane protein OmpA-like peptidoglycan-associated protein
MKPRVLAIVLAVVVVCGIGLYLWLAAPSSTAPKATAPASPSAPAAAAPATPSPSPAAAAATPAPTAEIVPPFAPQRANLVASDVGGVIESITSEYGPGYNGNRLIDGRVDPAWTPSATAFPQEIVFSFFNRQPALISSVMITAPAATAPKEVEVWTSTTGPADGFQKVAAQTLKSSGLDQVVKFDPVQASFVKLRVLSGYQEAALEIQEVQIPEAQRADYTSLAAMHPDMAVWKRSPRHAAQRGIEWLQAATMEWQSRNNCFGCHVQSQVIMGLVVSKESKYVVSDSCLQQLTKFVEKSQNPDGSYFDHDFVTATHFAAMGLSASDKASGTKSPALLKSADWLLPKQQKTGEIPGDHNEPPIDQGTLMVTANSVGSFLQAYNESGNIRYKQASQRALAWVAAATPDTTQDKVFKIIALSRYGNAQQKQALLRTVAGLKSEQNKDGGWQETKDMKGSNAFATGQVLYAFKQAGVSVESPEFSDGVRFLLANQKETGAWPSANSQSGRPSEFAPTMWAVIGLAGSFRESECAEVQRFPDRIVIRMCSRALFDFNQFNLKPDAAAVLAGIKSALLDQYPDAPLTVEGYTDDVGTVPYNMKLSMNRAQSVTQWMLQQGIVASRVKPVGYGKAKPRYPNTNEENRARNRRVEIVITLKANGLAKAGANR